MTAAVHSAKPIPAEAMAAARLLAYCKYQAFSYEIAPHHRLIAEHLEKVERGEIRRLMICMPPRRGKSELASKYFPAYFLGRNPDRSIIHASYSQDLADDFGRQVRNQLRDPAHRAIFPWCELRPDSTAVRRFHTQQGGVYIAAGIGGPITGRGAHLFLIDDPVKSRDDANSITSRDRIWGWFQSVAYSRLAPHGAIVLIMTRWHEDDLAGRLLKEHGDEWTLLSLPEIAEEADPLGRKSGDVLWPSRFTQEMADETRRNIGSREWASLYQQRPVRDGGNYLKLEWWGKYSQSPRYSQIIQSIDSAMKTGQDNDYSVIATFGVHASGYDLLDLWRRKAEAPDLERAVIAAADKWKPTRILAEDSAAMIGICQSLARASRLPIIPLKVHRDKVSRVQSVAGMVEAGKVRLPERADWLADFLDETSGFPSAAHDDTVDALTLFLNWARENESGPMTYIPVRSEKRAAFGAY